MNNKEQLLFDYLYRLKPNNNFISKYFLKKRVKNIIKNNDRILFDLFDYHKLFIEIIIQYNLNEINYIGRINDFNKKQIEYTNQFKKYINRRDIEISCFERCFNLL